MSYSSNTETVTSKKRKSWDIKKGLSKFGYGIGFGMIGAALVLNAGTILSGIGTAASSVGGALGVAGTAGALTIPLGGLGLGILATTAAAGVAYAGYKNYQYHHAKKSLFSNRDITAKNPETNKGGKLFDRTFDDFATTKKFGHDFGLITKLSKSDEAKYGPSNQVVITKLQNIETRDPQNPGQTYADNLRFLYNHEFTKQFARDKSTLDELKTSFGLEKNPFKELSPEGLQAISKLFADKAIDLGEKKCPHKSNICTMLSETALNLSNVLVNSIDTRSVLPNPSSGNSVRSELSDSSAAEYFLVQPTNRVNRSLSAIPQDTSSTTPKRVPRLFSNEQLKKVTDSFLNQDQQDRKSLLPVIKPADIKDFVEVWSNYAMKLPKQDPITGEFVNKFTPAQIEKYKPHLEKFLQKEAKFKSHTPASPNHNQNSQIKRSKSMGYGS